MFKPRLEALAAVSLVFVLACEQAPTSTAAPDTSPVFAVAGNSGCATVQFTWAGVPNTAPVTGDLQGTLTTVFSGDTKFAGVTMKNGGTGTWDITGGVLGSLAFVTEFDNKNFLHDRPGSPFLLFENIGKHRAVEGVEKANLHYKGTFNATTGQLDHDYVGVICP
jgi:hypothetical protein